MQIIKQIFKFLDSDRLEAVLTQTCVRSDHPINVPAICQPVLLGNHFSVLRKVVASWKYHDLLSIKI